MQSIADTPTAGKTSSITPALRVHIRAAEWWARRRVHRDPPEVANAYDVRLAADVAEFVAETAQDDHLRPDFSTPDDLHRLAAASLKALLAFDRDSEQLTLANRRRIEAAVKALEGR